LNCFTRGQSWLRKLLLSTNRNTNNSIPAIRPDGKADKELLLRYLCLP
jgi:hypothetical protein